MTSAPNVRPLTHHSGNPIENSFACKSMRCRDAQVTDDGIVPRRADHRRLLRNSDTDVLQGTRTRALPCRASSYERDVRLRWTDSGRKYPVEEGVAADSRVGDT